DELALRGRGRSLPWLAGLFALGALGLAGVPYTGSYLAHALVDDGASRLGIQWLQPLLWAAAAISAAAILRATARVFLGWGAAADALLSPEPPEEPPDRRVSFLPVTVVTA